jgi:hypothetical protein
MRFALLIFLAMPALAGYQMPGLPMLLPSPLGDSRLASQSEKEHPKNAPLYGVTLPKGEHLGFTVVSWARVTSASTNTAQLTTQAFWSGEPIQYFNPDLLAGACAHGVSGGTNMSGTLTVDPFPWQPYTDAHLSAASNSWRKGVYTVSGWASNAVTVSIGGTNSYFAAGEFTKNVIPGTSSYVSISSTGLVAIGISRTPAARFFNRIDGVQAAYGTLVSGTFSNQITICVWRFAIDGTNQIYR